MRYRRLGYRYAMVLTPGEPRMVANDWRAGGLGVLIAQPRWRPEADVFETESTIHVTVDLSGVEPDSLDVLLYQDALIVEGQRHLSPADSAGVYHVAQIRQGPFRLELRLPSEVDPDRVEAGYDQGLLQISLDKTNGK